ncbi:pyridine nucleotide-disulfide oxidoreductase [Massilia horti]|uniref:Pyridine nucleotide-disulfide oxidoreductase n=2 Tax=Massilia horti TaxID=2562153 RepID=A0A4Y9SXC0_9BURK|nr:pyridine nucleotide-disulfide oxidoreductase [Massilia horti]
MVIAKSAQKRALSVNKRQDDEHQHVDFLLVGGGVASATAAETLRHEGAEGSIVIVTDEQELPYHRPPLSTTFQLADSPAIPLVLSADYYLEHAIHVMLGTRVLAVDPQRQLVHTDRSGPVHYGKLLIATGSRPVRLSVPGCELAGIHYLRSLVDAWTIKRAASEAKRVVVVGGGFLGLELAATFVQRGLQVSLLALRHVLFEKLRAPEVSAYVQEMYTHKAIEIILDDTVAEFRGNGRIESVVTQAGRILPCDFAAIGIGAAPDVEFLAGSGLALDNGICVDQHLRTSDRNIFAAGDVANFFDRVFGVRRRIEHWDNALKQGRVAAKNMLDLRLPYDEVPYFSCQLFDFGFQFLGMLEETSDYAALGSLRAKSYALLYLKNDVPRALFSAGRPAKETRAIESLIRYRTNLGWAKDQLGKPGFSLMRIPSQTAIILQGGGALGAFECGVVHALEDEGVYPDIVAGVSIGAFNGAIIAANPRNAGKALEAFWQELSMLALDLPDEQSRRLLASWQALAFGVPSFFRPRWATPQFNVPAQVFWTSLYDPTPVKELLGKYVDFNFLESSPVRLLVSAVNVETARLEVFDSYVDHLTPDHILASGSLPPGFPWTTIDGKHYWDGGIMSNSPLELVLERCGAGRKQIFIVDLFPNKKALPTNLVEVVGRRDEIVYTERIRRDSMEQSLVSDFRKLVGAILSVAVDPGWAEQVRQWPIYIQLMGDDDAKLDITRITREGSEGESASKDYDFSMTSIANNVQAGYEMAQRAINDRRQSWRMQPVASGHG